jgi:hypothetical protein
MASLLDHIGSLMYASASYIYLFTLAIHITWSTMVQLLSVGAKFDVMVSHIQIDGGCVRETLGL